MEDLIKGLYTNKLVTIKQGQLLGEAEELMNNHNIRHLPVVDEKEFLVGLLSKSDFMGLKYVDSRLNQFQVKQLMSSPVTSVSQFAKIKEVAKLFIDKKIGCALVINNKEVVGIITTEDLLKYLLIKTENEVEIENLELSHLLDEEWTSAYAN